MEAMGFLDIIGIGYGKIGCSVDGDKWNAIVWQQLRMLDEYHRKLDGTWGHHEKSACCSDRGEESNGQPQSLRAFLALVPPIFIGVLSVSLATKGRIFSPSEASNAFAMASLP